MPAILVANNTRLHVRLVGPAHGPALLMIQGLGMQMTDWPRALLAALSQHHRLVLFDNRDYGRSTSCGPAIDPALREADYPFAPVPQAKAPYSLHDMAADALGLMDALRIDCADVLGFSMGGMIAQIMAAQHPDRVRSLVSLMSSGGQAALPADTLGSQALARMIVHVPDRARLIRQMTAAQRLWSGPHYEIDPNAVARHLELSYRRCYRPAAIHRQALAYASAGDRSDLLRRIRCPSLVIHGKADPIIPLCFAEAAARLIPGARLLTLSDAAHDLHPTLLPRLSAAIRDHLGSASDMRFIHFGESTGLIRPQ
jgi:pimeloyl-ACP methyl ester carboxylesterase